MLPLSSATRLREAWDNLQPTGRVTDQGTMCKKAYRGAFSRQRIEQCAGLLEVGGIKPFGEPAIDLGQELAGCGALALLLPQASQAHGGAQFPRPGLLAAGYGEGLLKAGFRCSPMVRRM